MKKIIISSITIVSISIIILSFFIYKKESNENEKMSANTVKKVDPSSYAISDNFSDKIAQKIKSQKEYSQDIKKTKTSSNIPNITNDQIMEALNTLVNDNSGMNSYDTEQSQFKMEFELTNIPPVSQYEIADGLDHYSYRIDYEYIKNDNNSNEITPFPSVKDMQLTDNNTFINDSMARFFSVSIYMSYDADENYTSRERVYQHINDTAENSESRDLLISNADENYPKRANFNQGVSFIMRSLNFSGKLNVPRVINIWNEHSSQLFPCQLYSNELIKGYNENPDTLINNDEYSLQYYCLKLPNYNDYTGKLKILFD